MSKLNKNQLVANEKSDECDEWENEKILAQKYFEQNVKMKAKARKNTFIEQVEW